MVIHRLRRWRGVSVLLAAGACLALITAGCGSSSNNSSSKSASSSSGGSSGSTGTAASAAGSSSAGSTNSGGVGSYDGAGGLTPDTIPSMAQLQNGNAPPLPSGTPLAGKNVAVISAPPTIPWGGRFNPAVVADLHKLGAKTTLQVYTSQTNPAQQAQQFNTALTQHPSAIVIEALDQQGLVPQLTRAKAQHIPVIVTGPPLAPTISSQKLAATAETAAHYSIGVLSAKMMVQGLKAEGLKKGNILIIAGSTADGSSAPRVAGFKAELAKAPQFKVVGQAYSNWDPTTAAQVTGPLLAKFSKQGINGIFGISGYVAVGAMQAVKQAGLKIGVANKGVVFVGGNCNRSSWQALQDGTEYGDFVQWPAYDANAVSGALVAAVQGKSLPASVTPPLFELTKKNAAKYKALCNY